MRFERLIFLVFFIVGCSNDEYVEITKFTLKNGSEIVFTQKSFCDVGYPVYYEIQNNHSVIVPKTVLGNFPCEITPVFQLMVAEEGNLAGVIIGSNIPKSLYEKVILIHDFKSGKSFPYNTKNKKELYYRIIRVQ